ncbi:MAG: hypothetical protein KJ646_03370 [Nanoarchaeota archaeon]|nr:hypothetical protein [Nanoarchaeota archaeon]MBU4116907.1 hypothetical protein [Nanoarchaeota archaeon]
MKKEFIKETARDIIALGGVPFFILVLVRVAILSKPDFLLQFLLAGVIFLLINFLVKTNLYSGLGLIILIFTSLYYNDLKFSIFASLVYVGLISSLVYLKSNKKEIIKGVLLGVLSSAISYYLVKVIFYE